MRNFEFERELKELSSAEDFLDYFEIDYDPRVVHVNRLHILQRFHDYLEKDLEAPKNVADCEAYYKSFLFQAYNDFVHSDARTEKVFKVLQPHTSFVPLELVRK
ncbi:MAG: nitrogen fixation protein NifW [Hyphomicrobiaceae bacterium]|nr:nitrogen fixation protein NifW [Hyphomicrobiaceae bacterium]